MPAYEHLGEDAIDDITVYLAQYNDKKAEAAANQPAPAATQQVVIQPGGLTLFEKVLIGIIFGLRFLVQGMLFHLPSVAIGRWFGQNKGKATSISVLGFSFGEAIFPIIMTFIISYVGWKFSWSFGGILLILILPIIITLLKVERIPKSSLSTITEQTGLNDKHWTRKEVLKFWLFGQLLYLY